MHLQLSSHDILLCPLSLYQIFAHINNNLFLIADDNVNSQVLIWAAIPSLRGSNAITGKHTLRLIVLFQFLLRLYLIFPLSSNIISTVGVIVEAAWAGAAYNLMLFMLASHVSLLA